MIRRRERTNIQKYLGKSYVGMLVQNIISITILIVGFLLEQDLIKILGAIFVGFGFLTFLILYTRYRSNTAGSYRIRKAINRLENSILRNTMLIENGAVEHPEIYAAEISIFVREKLSLEVALRNNERLIVDKDDPLFT